MNIKGIYLFFLNRFLSQPTLLLLSHPTPLKVPQRFCLMRTNEGTKINLENSKMEEEEISFKTACNYI